MVSGEWGMMSGEWGMVGGEWGMQNVSDSLPQKLPGNGKWGIGNENGILLRGRVIWCFKSRMCKMLKSDVMKSSFLFQKVL